MSLSELHRSDARARAQALDVTRSFIVQAPAGSGKTELLTQRFLVLLGRVREPESVLAITFTRKAAAEMRERILGAMQEVARPGSTGRPWQPATLQAAAQALAADQRNQWRLLDHPGRLRVQTIDSLNLGLARRLPLLSGLGSGLDVRDDGRELYRIAAERLLQHLPAGEPAYEQAVASVLAHLDGRVAGFVDLVVEMLARREAWLPHLPHPEADAEGRARQRAKLESARARLVAAHLEALEQEFPPVLLREAVELAALAARTLEASGAESPILACLGRDAPLRGDESDLSCWRALAEFLLTKEGKARKTFNVTLGVSPGKAGSELKQRAMSLAGVLSGDEQLQRSLHLVRVLPPAVYDEDEWQALASLLQLMRLAAGELDVVFAEHAAADYPRFARAALNALGGADEPTDTALALDARLEHVLVDEFQDTSESQVELLAALTAGWQPGDGRTLFLVGDPMQSIYRFRNAEVGLFLDVRDRGLGGLELEPLQLRVNFRSTAPVVSWINEAFAAVLPRHDDAFTGAVSFAESVAAEEAGNEGGVCVHPLFRRSRDGESRLVAQIAAERLAADPDARVGILVQARSHLVGIVAELARAGLRFQATDIDPLGERPAVLDLLQLTRAIAHLADRPAWLAALRAPWCGLSLGELHALVGDDADATVLELLRDPVRMARLPEQARRRAERFLAAIEPAVRELRRKGLRDGVETAWIALGGPATLEEERGLAEARAYLAELAELSDDDAGWPDLRRLTLAMEDLYAPSPAREDVRIELMTVHKAKGLQFDTVIVPGLERAPGRDNRRLLRWMELPDARERELVVAPIARRGFETRPLYAWLERLEDQRLQHEQRRLLYVAATRARRWLHLIGSVKLRDDGSSQSIVRPIERVALGKLWSVVAPHFEQSLGEQGRVEGEPEREIEREPLLRRVPADWQLPSPPRAPRISSRAPAAGDAEPPVTFDWATETARHVGTLVHHELQRIASGRPQRGDESSRRKRYEWQLAELGVPPEHRPAAVERAWKAVERALQDERGRWLLDPAHRDSECELALTGPLGGEIVNIVIDRSFVDEEGRRWIVDYKTSSHEGAGLDEFLDRELDRYRPQLERYAELAARLGPEPIRLGLYFPLLGGWREWRPGGSDR